MLRGHVKCCPSAVNIFLLKGHTIPYLVRNVWYLVRNMWLPSSCTSHSPSAPKRRILAVGWWRSLATLRATGRASSLAAGFLTSGKSGQKIWPDSSKQASREELWSEFLIREHKDWIQQGCCTLAQRFLKHRPSGPMLSRIRNVHLSVRRSVCPGVHFWGTV